MLIDIAALRILVGGALLKEAMLLLTSGVILKDMRSFIVSLGCLFVLVCSFN